MASRSTDPLRSTSESPSAEPISPTPASSPAAHAPPLKRSRQAALVGDMEYDDLPGASRHKKSKKATTSQTPTPAQLSPSIQPLAGPSSSLSFIANVQFTAKVTGPQTEPPSADLSKSTAIPLLNRGDGVADGLQEELDKLRREVAHLKEQLGSQVKNQEAAKLQTVQQMMLDRIREQKESNYRLEKLQRQRHYAVQNAKQQEAECEKQRKKVDETSKKCAKLLIDVNYLRDETEHLQAMNKTMEEDLDELRRIDNEDRAWRRESKRDLPPAYGSLDDEVSWEPLLHQDSGSFEIASLKRTVHNDFSNALINAQMTADATRNSDSSIADTLVFLQTSLALADSSRVLKAALDRAEALSVMTIQATAETSIVDSSVVQKNYASKRRATSRAFAADRMAKVLLNLVWRIVSATELRPVTLNIQSREKTRLCLAYKQVDDTFHEALRQAFLLGKSNCPVVGRLHEYQYYLTQLNAVRHRFANLGAGLSYSLFKRSWEWLSEEVELERMKRANEEPGEAALTLDDTARVPDHGSEVSSEQAPTESDSSEVEPRME